MKSNTSVIIPAFNEEKNIPSIMESLKKQTIEPLEILLVDDCSTDNTVKVAEQYFKVIKLPKNSGPGGARNAGMKAAKGKYLGFLDADVKPRSNWIEQVETNLSRDGVMAIVGAAYIPKSTYIGDSISALGFPGGGHIGSEKLWKMEADGAMNHIGGLNFAIRKEVFEKLGGFDEQFSIYCEDADYANHLWDNNVRIRYIPELIIEHEPTTSLKYFFKWHFKRGLGNYIFKKKNKNVNKFIKLRIWSSMNIIKAYYKDSKIFMIIFLLLVSFISQQVGFIVAKIRDKNEKK